MRRHIAATLISLSLCASAHAADDPLGAAVGAIAQGLVQESDVGLVFDYLREAFDGALQGREVSPPEALARRAEAIAEEAKHRGALAGRALIDAIERSIRESMRTPPTGASRSSI
jgi:hypothetical protein